MSKINSIHKLIALLAILIFSTETILMLILDNFLPTLNKEIALLFDATSLIVILSPAFYFIIYSPMNKMIKKLELSEESLKQHNLEIIKLNNTKEKIFSIIAHDLKNPFACILSSADAISKCLSKDIINRNQIEKQVSYIQTSIKKENVLLENLLEWSMAQTGCIKYNPIKINLTDIIQESVSIMKMNIENKGIKIGYSEQTYEVYADKNMIYTVIRNLLSNAIKFTPQNGEINIIVNPNNDKIETVIYDSGIGMTQEVISNLFNIETTTTAGTNNEKGTGLGLILCKEFIERNCGTIRVESKQGIGSKFIFSLSKFKG